MPWSHAVLERLYLQSLLAVWPRSILVVLVASLDDGLLLQQLGIDLDMVRAVRKVSKVGMLHRKSFP